MYGSNANDNRIPELHFEFHEFPRIFKEEINVPEIKPNKWA